MTLEFDDATTAQFTVPTGGQVNYLRFAKIKATGTAATGIVAFLP